MTSAARGGTPIVSIMRASQAPLANPKAPVTSTDSAMSQKNNR